MVSKQADTSEIRRGWTFANKRVPALVGLAPAAVAIVIEDLLIYGRLGFGAIILLTVMLIATWMLASFKFDHDTSLRGKKIILDGLLASQWGYVAYMIVPQFFSIEQSSLVVAAMVAGSVAACIYLLLGKQTKLEWISPTVFVAFSILLLAIQVWNATNKWLLESNFDAFNALESLQGGSNRLDSQSNWSLRVSAKGMNSSNVVTSRSDHLLWSYDGATGPFHWASLHDDYVLCGAGKLQSPIDIPRKAVKSSEAPSLRWIPVRGNIHHGGPLTELSLESSSITSLRGNDFKLKKILIHSPSEHQLSGLAFPMEMQFIHESASGKMAAFAVFIEIGSRNAEVDKMIPYLASKMDESKPGFSINPRKLMPDNFDHFQYQGSLTTPPCTEGVSWYVLANAVQMSADQVSALRGAHGQSSRMLQSLGARTFKVESQMHSH